MSKHWEIITPTCPQCGAYDFSYWYSIDKMKCGDCGYIGSQDTKLDLPKMEQKLDEVLANETPESLVGYMWKDIEKEDSMNFICKDPDCPHCIEELNQMSDDDELCIVCDEKKLTHQVCMDCIVKTNHEISDEEIYKASRKHITDGGGAQGWIEAAFRQGAKWYREQLRLKTDKQ